MDTSYITQPDTSSSSRVLSSDGRVHELALPTSTAEASFDVIAIHGYYGHWKFSWTSHTGFFWLKDVLPDILPSCRVISYDCADLSRDLANRDVDGMRLDLINNRRNCNRSQTPIIFLGANFGGSLIKELFISSSPQQNQRAEAREFHASIRGFVFFSTIQGSQALPDNLNPLPLFFEVFTMGLSSKPKELEKIFKQIPSINYDFRRLWGERIPSVCFYDTVKGFGVPLGGLSLATMASSSSEKVPLDVDLTRMTRFDSRGDPNLLRVLNTLQEFFQRAQQPAFQPDTAIRSEYSQYGQRGLRILSLDGGGVRGLFSIMVLEKVMEEVHRLEGGIGSTPKPCEIFNLIAGTSTGGLLAIMLGRLQMDLVSCKQAYLTMSKDIFRRAGFSFPGKQWADALRGVPWFSGEALQVAVRKVIHDRINPTERRHLTEIGVDPAEAPLLCPIESAPKCFICAIVDATYECVRLRTYNFNSGADEPQYKIWEAGRATSAAPLYFPPMEIQGHRYYDGGMQSNNPILEAIEEAYLLYGEDASISAMVSIGTGKSQGHEPGGNLIRVIQSLTARAVNTEAKHDEFLLRYKNLNESYFRFQELNTLGKIDLAASDKLEEIEKLAEDYLISEHGRDLISKCAWKLHRPS